MEKKIDEILERIFSDSIEFDRNKACEELLNLFPVIKCQCIIEVNERFPSELINKKCDNCDGVL